MAEAAARTPVRLLSFDDPHGKSLKERLPFFTETVIDEGVYEGVLATRTLGVGAQWLVRGDVPEELVYGITRALWHPNTRRLLDNGHPKGPSIQLEQCAGRSWRSRCIRAPHASTAKSER